jgi:hypothetical protein
MFSAKSPPELPEVNLSFDSCSITPLLFQNAVLSKDLGVKPKDVGSKFADFEAKSGDGGVSFCKNLVKKRKFKLLGDCQRLKATHNLLACRGEVRSEVRDVVGPLPYVAHSWGIHTIS